MITRLKSLSVSNATNINDIAKEPMEPNWILRNPLDIISMFEKKWAFLQQHKKAQELETTTPHLKTYLISLYTFIATTSVICTICFEEKMPFYYQCHL